jgi:hypothetical protein
MKLLLTIALSVLTISVPAFAQTAVEAPVYATRPVGDGDPNAISCYVETSGIWRIHAKQCKTNAEWARIRIANRNQFRGDFPQPGNPY